MNAHGPFPHFSGDNEMKAADAGQTKSSKPTGAISGGFWTVVERITAQTGQLIVFIAAARILGPADFGTFALVSAVAILMLRVSEFGWAQYIMSWDGDDTRPRQVLFVAILTGVAAAVVGLAATFILYLLGAGHSVLWLLALFSMWLIPATTSSTQKGIMIWQDRLKSSAAAETLGEIAGMVAALISLFSGFGVLALVFGRLTFQSVHLVVSFWTTRMAPASGLKGADLRALLSFSWSLFLTRMVVNFRIYMATFLIGGFLGPAAVGYYRAAERLVGAVAEVVAVPSEVLAWSLFRRSRDTNGGLQGFHAQAQVFFKVLFALSVPVFIWVAVMGPELVATILGPEWLPAVPVVAILALARVIMLPGHATEAILSLAGQIRRLVPFSLIYLVIGLGLTFIGAQLGLRAVAVSQVLVSVVAAVVTVWLQTRYGQIRWTQVAKGCASLAGPAIGGLAALIAAKSLAKTLTDNDLASVAIATVFSVGVYLVLLLVTHRELRAAVREFRPKQRGTGRRGGPVG